MDSEVLLQTHAEMAIAITGFASVIAALSRPLTAFSRQRFFSLLALSVIQILGCLIPLWFLHLMESSSTVWRLTSIIILPVATRLIYGGGYLGFACLALNSIGIGFRPNFDLYYAGLLATLLVGFALFADVATRES